MKQNSLNNGNYFSETYFSDLNTGCFIFKIACVSYLTDLKFKY